MHAVDSIVFIVNADQAIRAWLERAAITGGFNVVAFATAAAYLAYSRPDLPACHILDVSLPDMSGLALQTSIAAHGSAVMFVTRQADVFSTACAFKAGATDFLTMPVADSDLVHAIRSAIDRAEKVRTREQGVAALRQRWNILTTREREVLQLVVSGCLNKQAASELGISEITVKAHRGRVMTKMCANSFADLVRMAVLLDVPLVDGRHGARSAVVPTPRRHLEVFEQYQAA